MSVLVRETQRLAVTYEIETPSGRRYRWAPDEWSPENVPLDATFTDTMPGGFDSLDVTLRRYAAVDYEDLERLSTIRVRDASHAIVGEYRLERTPRSSGDDLAIRPSAVGWQAHLEDNKNLRQIYVDRDFSRWSGPSNARVVNLIANLFTPEGPETQSAPTGYSPALVLKASGAWTANSRPIAEAWYDAGGVPIGSLYYAWTRTGSPLDQTNTSWWWQTHLSTDDVFSSVDSTASLRAEGPGSGTLSATTSDRDFATLQLGWSGGAAGAENWTYPLWWTCLAVYGTAALTKRGTATATMPQGFYASDIVRHAISEWAPWLATTDDSVATSALIITQAAYLDPTTAAEVIRDVTRYELLDWAVWDNRTFYLHARGARGRSWRARVGPTKLEETGPQVDRVWNGVVVEYKDAAGGTRTVGPVGSRSDTETTDLIDPDPDNPANQFVDVEGLPLRRWERVQLDTVGDPDSALSLGRAFLQETKRLDRSGRATIVGYVEDDRGVTWPYHAIRAGDTIAFVDAADPSPRRIVRTSKDTASRSCTVDLDAPPEGLQAVLARLGLFMGPS